MTKQRDDKVNNSPPISHAKHKTWENNERVLLLKEYFEKSRAIRDEKELRTLKEQMLNAINQLSGPIVKISSAQKKAKLENFGSWGMTPNIRKDFDTVICKSIMEDTALSPKQKQGKLIAEMSYFNSWRALTLRLKELGFSPPLLKNMFGKKVKSCWNNPDFIACIRQLIEHERVLVENDTLEDGLRKIIAITREKFTTVIAKSNEPFNIKTLKKNLDGLVWTQNADKAMQEIVRMRLSPKKDFAPLFSHIPFQLIEKRVRWYRGVSRTTRVKDKALPGIGRIRISEDIGEFKIPNTSFNDPLVLPIDNLPKEFSLSFLNGANIGTQYEDMVSNTVRRALSDADHCGDCAVIMTNILHLDLKKSSGAQKTARARIMGDNVNPEIFADEEYRDEARRILEEKPLDEMVYQTADELFQNVLSGWRMICLKPNDTLEFGGPIFIVLGPNEEQIINDISAAHQRYWTKAKENALRAKRRVAEKALAGAEKRGDMVEMQKLSDLCGTLQDRIHRTLLTDISSDERNRFSDLAQATVIKKIEETIPNSKVIGLSTTYVKIGDEIIEINIPGHIRVTDSVLADYTGSYGPKNRREQLASTVVICHPWALNYRMTVREADYSGTRGSAQVFVAPIAVGDAYLRRILSNTVIKSHPLAKAVFREQFCSGMLRLSYTNGKFDHDVIYGPALEAHERRKEKKRHIGKKVTPTPLFYGGGPKYIWVHTGTDPHEGGRAKEWVRCKQTGKVFGMSDAVFEMMRRGGLCEKGAMPVHIFSVNDDPTQGQNFPARTQPDPHQLPPWEMEKLVQKIERSGKSARSKKGAVKAIETMTELVLHQLQKRGTDFPHEQMFQMMERYVSPNVDVFSAILHRAKKAKLSVCGVGEYAHKGLIKKIFGGYDTRNVGVINLGSGNHLANTIGGEIIEGPFYANHLKNLLLQLPEWQNNRDFIEHHVVAPSYSGEAIAWGRISIPGGYEYGLELRASPTRMSGWGDPLRGEVNNDPQRGNYSRIFNGKFVLNTFGDKHFFSGVGTSYSFYHMCAAGTHTDRYGERGFPPNNTGVSFVGLPVDGPDSGPILVRLLPYDVIKSFIEVSPRQFDWEKFLPNPV